MTLKSFFTKPMILTPENNVLLTPTPAEVGVIIGFRSPVQDPTEEVFKTNGA